LNLILLFATAMQIRYLFVPITTNNPPIEEENINTQHLTVYEKIQLSLLEYELSMMYGTTYVKKYYTF